MLRDPGGCLSLGILLPGRCSVILEQNPARFQALFPQNDPFFSQAGRWEVAGARGLFGVGFSFVSPSWPCFYTPQPCGEMCLILFSPEEDSPCLQGRRVGDTKSKLRPGRAAPWLFQGLSRALLPAGGRSVGLCSSAGSAGRKWRAGRALGAGKIEGRTGTGLMMRWELRDPEAGVARGFAVLTSPSAWGKITPTFIYLAS